MRTLCDAYYEDHESHGCIWSFLTFYHHSLLDRVKLPYGDFKAIPQYCTEHSYWANFMCN